jgi:hypothetical protein
MKRIKKWILWGILGAAFYFVLSYHFIVINSSVKMLQKIELGLNYTFFSTKAKTNETIMRIDELREAGIGDLLVEMGRITEEEKEKLIAKFE